MTALLLAAVLLAPPASARGSPAVPAVPAAPGTAAPSEDEVAARVRSYLGAIDRPVRAEAWRALGPAAVPHLEAALAGEPLSSRRAAAAEGLAAIGGDRAREALLARARAEDERYVVRAAALRGAGRLLAPGDAAAALGPVLRDARSAEVRRVAAETLAETGDAGACAAVRAQARREGTRGAPRFSKALERCR